MITPEAPTAIPPAPPEPIIPSGPDAPEVPAVPSPSDQSDPPPPEPDPIVIDAPAATAIKETCDALLQQAAPVPSPGGEGQGEGDSAFPITPSLQDSITPFFSSIASLLRKGDAIVFTLSSESAGLRLNVMPRLFTLDSEKGEDRRTLNQPLTITGSAEEFDSPALLQEIGRFTGVTKKLRSTIDDVEAAQKHARETKLAPKSSSKPKPAPKPAPKADAPKQAPAAKPTEPPAPRPRTPRPGAPKPAVQPGSLGI